MLAAELYQRVRRRLDIQPSSYLDDNEIGQVCTEQYLELYDLLYSSMGDEAPWQILSTNVVANTATLTLAEGNGIHRIVRIDFLGPGNIWDPVSRFELGDEGIDDNARAWVSARSFRYAARRSQRAANSVLVSAGAPAFASWNLYFTPKPAQAYALRIYYLPPPRIVVATNPSAPPAVTYSEFPDEFPEYVVEGAAAVFAAKQEIDPSPFITSKARIATSIERYYRPHQINQTRMVLDQRRMQTDELDEYSDFQNRGRYR